MPYGLQFVQNLDWSGENCPFFLMRHLVRVELNLRGCDIISKLPMSVQYLKITDVFMNAPLDHWVNLKEIRAFDIRSDEHLITSLKNKCFPFLECMQAAWVDQNRMNEIHQAMVRVREITVKTDDPFPFSLDAVRVLLVYGGIRAVTICAEQLQVCPVCVLDRNCAHWASVCRNWKSCATVLRFRNALR